MTVVLEGLQKGLTIREAIDLAMLEYVPLIKLEDDTYEVVSPLVKGDGGTRLVYVYFSLAERFYMQSQSLPLNVWWTTLPVQP